ncbi:protein RarD [Agromyces rhizosphaerae]|uniref:Protein RarD n=1 Tax=Agromyces rhizosphaerae TaxID=88374 RepID=A0A9W6FQ00_9MICO|nr:EamA family transporter RarD [Agromyces rhizosphaerae]GLI28005.1 protein RarD [Agromyces rhizosphaerae]
MTDSPRRASRATVDAPAGSRRAGFAYAFTAYGLWGVLPLYFLALAPTGPFEIVAWRVLLSLGFCAILLTVGRAWRALGVLVRDRRVMFVMAAAGALIYVNWQTYVYATATGRVVETSLGYFINPIVTVFLGVLVLGERLRVLQWVAVGISFVAVVVLTVAHGGPPWIALVLAFSFGLYGLIKKRVGARVDAVAGLTLETAWLAPVALVQLVVVAVTSGLTLGTAGPWHALLLLCAGAVTAVPLLAFAAGSRRLPLVSMGFIQYLAPVLQFIVGVAVLGEPMPLERWIGFALVWIAIGVLLADLARAAGRDRRARRALAASEDRDAPEAPVGPL